MSGSGEKTPSGNILRKCAAWVLYWLGHRAEKLDWGNSFQWLMMASAVIQNDGPGPWKRINRLTERAPDGGVLVRFKIDRIPSKEELTAAIKNSHIKGE